MRKQLIIAIVCFALVCLASISAYPSVDWALRRTLEVGEIPLDVAVSYDGRFTFVLGDKGNVLIFSADGKLEDRIFVGKDSDKIAVSPRGDTLYVNNHKDKTVKILSLQFIKEVDISGSPFKGPVNAPVVITVFNDFQ